MQLINELIAEIIIASDDYCLGYLLVGINFIIKAIYSVDFYLLGMFIRLPTSLYICYIVHILLFMMFTVCSVECPKPLLNIIIIYNV